MDLCRWSSEDFGSDLVCTRTDDGFVIEVAETRIVGDVPKLLPMPEDRGGTAMADWVSAYNAQASFVKSAERKPIGLPHVGETFHDADETAFRQRLSELRDIGYRFPDYVLERLDDARFAVSL